MGKRRTSSTTGRSEGGRIETRPRSVKSSGRSAVVRKVASAAAPTHEQIAQRAYEIWVAKGRPQGLDEVNWREAEAQLLAGAR